MTHYGCGRYIDVYATNKDSHTYSVYRLRCGSTGPDGAIEQCIECEQDRPIPEHGHLRAKAEGGSQ